MHAMGIYFSVNRQWFRSGPEHVASHIHRRFQGSGSMSEAIAHALPYALWPPQH